MANVASFLADHVMDVISVNLGTNLEHMPANLLELETGQLLQINKDSSSDLVG